MEIEIQLDIPIEKEINTYRARDGRIGRNNSDLRGPYCIHT